MQLDKGEVPLGLSWDNSIAILTLEYKLVYESLISPNELGFRLVKRNQV